MKQNTDSGASEGDIHVLHVEDDPDFRDLTVTCLQQESPHIRVDTAGNPSDALDKLPENAYDCIVSDYDMPDRNGLEFLESVRDEYPDLPFILFTGKGSEEVASEAITTGVTDYLQKTGGLSQYTVLANRITNAVERHRSKRALESSEKRLSLFVDQSPLGVIEWNEEFECLRLNDAAEEILGYAADELVGSSWEQIVPESEHENVGSIVDELLEAKGGFHSINENVRKDGERIVCEWHNHFVTTDPGEVVAIFSQFQDITERRDQKQQLETLVDNLPGFVYRHRTESGYPLEFTKGSVESVTGYTATELATDINFAENIIHPDDREYVDTESDRQIEETGRFNITYRIVTKDNETRWVLERGARVDDPVTGEEMLEGFISDITAHRESERQLSHSAARLKALFDKSPDMILVHDTDGNIVDTNPRLQERTGYDEKELSEMKVWDIDRELTPEEASALWEKIDSGNRNRFETVYQYHDGSEAPVEVHLRRLEFDGDNHFVSIVRELTSQSDERQR